MFLVFELFEVKIDAHLGVMVGMYSQRHFNLIDFSYDKVLDSWMGGVEIRRYGIET